MAQVCLSPRLEMGVEIIYAQMPLSLIWKEVLSFNFFPEKKKVSGKKSSTMHYRRVKSGTQECYWLFTSPPQWWKFMLSVRLFSNHEEKNWVFHVLVFSFEKVASLYSCVSHVLSLEK